MKVYVAGKFEKKDQVLEIHRQLRKLGHTISYDWTVHQNIKPYQENQTQAKQYAKNEIQGIIDSDIYIYLSADAGHTLHMEIGAAMTAKQLTGKPTHIYVVGEFNNKSPWFFNDDLVIRKDTIEKVIDDIRQLPT